MHLTVQTTQEHYQIAAIHPSAMELAEVCGAAIEVLQALGLSVAVAIIRVRCEKCV